MSTVFIARRVDGLGCRLIAMLNAMMLAEHKGGRFAFSWKSLRRPFNAVDDLDGMFDPAFAKAYRYSRIRRNIDRYILRRHTIAGFDATLEDIETAVSRTRGSVIIDNARPIVASKTDSTPVFLADYARHFARIRFSARLERVRAFAAEVAIPEGSVALHLRAGDIIHGKHRIAGNYVPLAIPAPLARPLLQRLRDEGRTALIFSQDSETVDRLIADYGGIHAPRLFADQRFDDTEAALCEVLLMARCREIHAAGSAFATLAAMIAGTSVRAPVRDLGVDSAVGEIVGWVDGPAASAHDPLQVAFWAWSATHIAGETMDAETRIRLLRRAAACDPVNPLYRLRAASLLIDQGRADEAEDEIRRLLPVMDIAAIGWPDYANASYPRLANKLMFHYRTDMARCVAAARPDRPGFSHMAALARLDAGDLAGARALSDAARKAAPTEPRIAALSGWLARKRLLISPRALKSSMKQFRQAVAGR